jgi:hypothetical protein
MTETTDTRTLALVDDRGVGLAMFVTFTAAILIVTGAVAMLALTSTWWVLGLAFGIHVLMTAAVSFVVFSALDGGTRRPGSHGRTLAADDAEALEPPAPARIEPRQAYAAAA